MINRQKGTSPAIAADILGTYKDNTLSLQSGTCQAKVNSCQVGLWPYICTGMVSVATGYVDGSTTMVWYGMVDVYEGCLAAEASRSRYG